MFDSIVLLGKILSQYHTEISLLCSVLTDANKDDSLFVCIHWRSSHYAVMHVCNKKKVTFKCRRSPNVVKVIFLTIRNCSLGANSFL